MTERNFHRRRLTPGTIFVDVSDRSSQIPGFPSAMYAENGVMRRLGNMGSGDADQDGANLVVFAHHSSAGFQCDNLGAQICQRFFGGFQDFSVSI